VSNRPWKIIRDTTREQSESELNDTLEETLEAKRKEEAKSGKNEKQTDDQMGRMETYVAEVPRRRLDDLVVNETTVQQLKDMLAKVQYQYVLYDNWNLRKIDPYGGRTAVNLYGPPGTGKSFTAEAIANYLQKHIIRVNYAEIESKYVGDTPKNIKAAFAKAAADDAILFFDEADSILGRRMTNVTQSADHGVNVSRSVMLLELDRFEGITIFATNLASNYDSAFVRRILCHIEMPLPDRDCRLRLWRLHIPSEMPTQLTDKDFEDLADISTTLSGGDILNAVVIAATTAVQRTGAEQQVIFDDLKKATTQVKKSKDEVGNPNSHVRFSSQTIPLENAPLEVRQAAEKSSL